MEEILEKLAHCVEFGKINLASPYPPDLRGQEGADEPVSYTHLTLPTNREV